ncbi:hypothetical protein [Desulfosporosinus shakirovi]|uniref:hypothetical protein n=1 Tax=Desulfosporosinus shakirovi TaxID=2885154 RepID=UPI001E298E93|nr:hypothetical protein [Desulfosporosinus sp. SRJS8]MCB8814771.1 hypothetical protein [Desulfosporosinus sp. SRJS8]
MTCRSKHANLPQYTAARVINQVLVGTVLYRAHHELTVEQKLCLEGRVQKCLKN